MPSRKHRFQGSRPSTKPRGKLRGPLPQTGSGSFLVWHASQRESPAQRGDGENQVMEFQRSSGILLHISSLPLYGGIGDLGPAAYQFVEFLAAAKQHVWQVLPLCPTGFGNSPYAGSSAFAGNPSLISLEFLADWGWIDGARSAGLAGRSGAVDFGEVGVRKLPLLQEAAGIFLDRGLDSPALEDQWAD